MLGEKTSATQFARTCGKSATEVQKKLVQLGYIEVSRGGFHYLTELGRNIGGEWRTNHPGANDHEGYMVWPVDLLRANELQIGPQMMKVQLVAQKIVEDSGKTEIQRSLPSAKRAWWRKLLSFLLGGMFDPPKSH